MTRHILQLPVDLNSQQTEAVGFARVGGGSLAMVGPAGTGKSVALMARLAALVQEGRRPYGILVLVPQRAQAERYAQVLAGLDGPTRGGADILTYYGLSRRCLSLFWPEVAERAGFRNPNQEPIYLTLETTQYFMWRVVEPLIEEGGYFSDLTIRRERLLSQLVDNLNKSALVGFPHTEIYERLKGSWTGESEHLTRFLQAQDCATRFRAFCLERGLVDFSLATELFSQQVLKYEPFQSYAAARYEHLLVDNIEESVPVAQDMIRWLMGHCDSTVMALDKGGGFRIFLGADSEGGAELVGAMQRTIHMAQRYGTSRGAGMLAAHIHSALSGRRATPSDEQLVVDQGGGRYWISMVRWVARRAARLVGEESVLAREIAIIAPYVSEVMRFAIEEALREQGLGIYLLRPSTPLREDPVVRGLLILALLARPGWSIDLQGEAFVVGAEDVGLALHVALAEMDPVRARQLALMALPPGSRTLQDLSGTDQSGSRAQALGRMWESVGFDARVRYEALRNWLQSVSENTEEPLDLMMTRLFGEVLSRPGYGCYGMRERARPAGRLIESLQKYRLAVAEGAPELSAEEASRQYVETILSGIASADYLLDQPSEAPDDCVILAPAYAYLTRDLRSAYQFWIDLGSDGWWNRPNQPLTHPYVLSRRWQVGQPWRDTEEEASKQEALSRVVRGLASRCSKGVLLGFSDLGIDGMEQKGRFQRILQVALSQSRGRAVSE